MRIGKVIGTVTLNRWHPSLDGAAYKVVVPMGIDDLSGQSAVAGEELVVYDEWGAGSGSVIAISEGHEAAMPFYPGVKPVDAYNAAILDSVEIGTK